MDVLRAWSASAVAASGMAVPRLLVHRQAGGHETCPRSVHRICQIFSG